MEILSENEGIFLSFVMRVPASTAYYVAKAYQDLPITNYKTHKHKIYSIVDRLVARGFLGKRAVADDGRNTEQLFCTSSGRRAVREWVLEINAEHALVDDPWRMRVLSFDILTSRERIQWAAKVRWHLRAKLGEINAYHGRVGTPFEAIAYDNAVRAIRSRLDWVEGVIAGIAAEPESESWLCQTKGAAL